MYVVIRDMSAGNESVGEMWQETKVFPDDATLKEVMDWACHDNYEYKGNPPSNKRVTITRPHNDEKRDKVKETAMMTAQR